MKRDNAPAGEDRREEGEAGSAPVDVVTTSGRSSWLPLLAVLILMPAVSYAMMEYLVFPRMEARLAAIVTGEPTTGGGSSREGEGDDEKMYSHTFEDVIVNVSGTLGTRYLKTSFTIHSKEANLAAILESQRSRLLDSALATLSSLRLQDLEQPGARNFVRTELIDALNSSLGRPVVEELYFLDFIVQ